MRQIRAMLAKAWQNAWLLLALTTLMWAGNGVAGRLVAGQMSPMMVVTLRWLVACTILAFALRGRLQIAKAQLRLHWRQIAFMGVFGYTGFNVLFYSAAYYTTAININLLQSSIPIFVLAGAFVLTGMSVGPLQVGGMLISTLGVLIVATAGRPQNILSLAFNTGDVMVLAACALFAIYTLALRKRPAMDVLVFFAAMALAAFLSSLPFLIGEIALGHAFWPTPKGWAVLVYIALFPSLVSQLFYMRGVQLIGAGRAGLFSNLVPVFGSLLAVLILHESFHPYHALALALALGGIWLSESARSPNAPPKVAA